MGPRICPFNLSTQPLWKPDGSWRMILHYHQLYQVVALVTTVLLDVLQLLQEYHSPWYVATDLTNVFLPLKIVNREAETGCIHVGWKVAFTNSCVRAVILSPSVVIQSEESYISWISCVGLETSQQSITPTSSDRQHSTSTVISTMEDLVRHTGWERNAMNIYELDTSILMVPEFKVPNPK